MSTSSTVPPAGPPAPAPEGRRGAARRRLAVLCAASVLATSFVAVAVGPQTVAAEPMPTAAPGVAGAAAMSGYDLEDLVGPIPGLSQVDPVGIDESGAVAGTLFINGRPFGFRNAPGRPVDFLDISGAQAVTVHAIAADGTIVGTVFSTSHPEVEGLGVWKPDAEGVLGDFTRYPIDYGDEEFHGPPMAVNSKGDVLLGRSILHPDGSQTPLPPLDPDLPGANMLAHDMNEAGVVVGSSSGDPDGDGPLQSRSTATQWVDGVPSQIPGTGPYSDGRAINERGDIVVTIEIGYDKTAWLHRHEGGRTQIGTLADSVRVGGVNDDGTVVGAVFRNKVSYAFSWTNGQLTVLNDLLVPGGPWGLQYAGSINSRGQIAGDGPRAGDSAGFRLTPVNPVIFVHGAGASRLSTVVDGDREGDPLWIKCGEDRMKLSLWPDDVRDGRAEANIGAFDALHDETCFGIGGWYDSALDVYGPLLRRLEGQGGFVPYRTDGFLDRYTSEYCDTTQKTAGRATPNLFVFAYDWRKDNVESAERLADFMGCVRKFWPDRNANIITHSMGSLVARRYAIDHPDAPVDRIITTGAPWLGAPKLVNVLHTGDFAAGAVNGDPEIIKHIVSSFTASHQLMSGELYHEAALHGALREDGWDIDGNGSAHEELSFDQLKTMLDERIPAFRPGTAAATFQGSQGQVDWRDDDGTVDYTHIVGLQAGMNSIGTVVAKREVSCDFIGRCSAENVIENELVCGDGTVPIVSATRMVGDHDWNAPDGEVVVFQADRTKQNGSVEHTGLTANTHVYDIIDRLLRSDPDDDQPGAREALGNYGQDRLACMGAPAAHGLAASSSESSEVVADADHALRYVRLLGGTDLLVTDETGRSTEPPPVGLGGVPEAVTIFRSNVPHGALATMPVSLEHRYTVGFTATGAPLQLEVLEGTQYRPSKAVRWTDAQVPAGAAAELTLTPAGGMTLKVDSDGDGEPDSVRTPTVSLVGASAADVTAPTVSVTGTGTGAARRYAVTADDEGSGVATIRWSVDGTTFHTYGAPFAAPAGTTTVQAFAEDRAGNRSSMTEIALGDVPTTALTTAEISPAPAASGWNRGPVTVDLHAVADTAVSSITWSATGAQPSGETTTPGDAATIEITEPGTTVLRFSATTTDGSVEPVRTRTIRIDVADPVGRLQTPYAHGVTPDLDTLRGIATDDASGVTRVDIELRDASDRYWDGTAWVRAQTWLTTDGTAAWSRSTGNPEDDDLPAGGYRLRVRATDAAGRTGTSEPIPFTVSADAGYHITPIVGPADTQLSRATSINDRGAVLGYVQSQGRLERLVWTNAGNRPVAAGEVQLDIQPVAVELDGTVVGSAKGAGAATWAPDGTRTDIGPLGSIVTASNGLGTMVGAVESGAPTRWDDGVPSPLAPLAPGGTSETSDVNEAGVVVGETTLPGADVRTAVAWTKDGPRSLGTLGTPKYAPSRANALNDLGEVVGWSTDRNGTRQPVRFGEAGPVAAKNLFSFDASANDINDRGVVVGDYDSRYTFDRRPFLWLPEEDVARDLNELLPPDSGWVLHTASHVNELGQITGRGTYDGVDRAYVLSTVHAPVAEDQAVRTFAGEPIEFALDGWDPDLGDELSFELVDQPSSGSVTLLDSGRVRYVGRDVGDDTFTYRVTDGRFTSPTATVRLTVAQGDGPVNRRPTATVDAPASVAEGNEVRFDATGSTDTDGMIESYAWDLDGDGAFDDADTASVTVPAEDDGSIDAKVRVTDDGGAQDVAMATVAVTNVAPALAGLPTQLVATVGMSVTASGSVADVPADTVTVTVDAGDGSPAGTVHVTAGGFQVTHTYGATGVRTMTVTATDDDGGTSTRTVTVIVTSVPTPPPDSGIGGPGLISGATTSAIAGTKDTIGLATLVVVGRSSAIGAFGLERTGSQAMVLGSVTITKAGTRRVDGNRVGTIVGRGVVKTKKTSQLVTFEATLIDGRTDRLSVAVKGVDGKPVSALSFDDLPVAKGAIAIGVY